MAWFKESFMKHMIAFAAALTVVAPAAAFAQQAAGSAAPAPAASAAAAFNGDSPIEAIAASPAGKAALVQNFPDLLTHPAYEQFKGMSLKALAPLSGGIISDEKIAAFEASLKAGK